MLNNVFNIVEARFRNNRWTLMSELSERYDYNLVRWIDKQTGAPFFSIYHYQYIYDWVSLFQNSSYGLLILQSILGEMSMVNPVTCIFSIPSLKHV